MRPLLQRPISCVDPSSRIPLHLTHVNPIPISTPPGFRIVKAKKFETIRDSETARAVEVFLNGIEQIETTHAMPSAARVCVAMI